MPPALDASRIGWIFVGTVVSSELDRSLSISSDQLLVVDIEGTIAHVGGRHDAGEAAEAYSTLVADPGLFPQDRLVKMDQDAWILPGFVDTHIHAPQYVNAGMALDRPLMDWLEHYTFKAEAEIDRDPDTYGKRVYERLATRMVENGTTSASVFGTISVEANLVLAHAFVDAGLRGQIGKVAMDRNAPGHYVETTDKALFDTRRFIHLVRAIGSDLVEPVVTPRFVPTCTLELLAGLAEIAKDERVRVQSHVAESADEVELSRKLSPRGQTDVELFHELGLLHSESLMAHCTHLTPAELGTFAKTGTSIAHCPLSNVYFSPERTLALREAWNAGVDVGLGSDVSGGYRVGLDDQMRWAVGVSKLRRQQPESLGSDVADVARSGTRQDEGESRAISWKESLYLATAGGAKAMGLERVTRRARVGQLKVGYAFDAQLVQVGSDGLGGSHVDWFGELAIEDKVEKWWCNGTRVDRKGVWVQGRRILG